MLVVGAFISYQSALPGANERATPPGQRIAAYLTAAVLLWNAQFFAERVIVNYGAKSTQSTSEMYCTGMSNMLPRNLSKNSLSALARNLSRDSLLALADAGQ